MKYRINENLIDGLWYNFDEDLAFKIKPIRGIKVDYNKVFDIDYNIKTNIQCIVDWRGVVDKDDNPLPFSAAFLGDLLLKVPDLQDWFYEKIAEVNNKFVESLKN